jgi:hypothetical protein
VAPESFECGQGEERDSWEVVDRAGLAYLIMMFLLADLVLESSMGVIQTSNRSQQRSERVLTIHPAIKYVLPMM